MRRYNKPPKNPHVKLTISTWEKDSHGLYDYQAGAQHYNKEKYYLENECRIYRNADSINLVMVLGQHTTIHSSIESKKIADQNIHIGNLVICRDRAIPSFKLIPSTIKTDQPSNDDKSYLYKPFFVLPKQYQDINGLQGYNLEPGNIIKLGRAQYMVIELKNNKQTFTVRDTNHFTEIKGTIKAKSGVNVGMPCKICLSEEETQNNPLFCACNCKGTCAAIHVDCLRQWINSKVKKQLQGISTSYNFTKFQCQICKCSFPKSVEVEDQEIHMMSITKPDRPYIILESLTNKYQEKQERCLHLISAQEDQIIRIGRGHTCEIRVSDISVSRNHGEIVFNQNKFLLRDSGSKFGTLIGFDKEKQILASRPVQIQLGRTLLHFESIGQPIEVDTQ